MMVEMGENHVLVIEREWYTSKLISLKLYGSRKPQQEFELVGSYNDFESIRQQVIKLYTQSEIRYLSLQPEPRSQAATPNQAIIVLEYFNESQRRIWSIQTHAIVVLSLDRRNSAQARMSVRLEKRHSLSQYSIECFSSSSSLFTTILHIPTSTLTLYTVYRFQVQKVKHLDVKSRISRLLKPIVSDHHNEKTVYMVWNSCISSLVVTCADNHNSTMRNAQNIRRVYLRIQH